MLKKNFAALALMLALAAPLLVSCGAPASANPAPPAPTFPPPPPLDPGVPAHSPEPTPPPAPTAQASAQAAVLLADSFDDPQLAGWTPTTFFDRGVGVRWEARVGELRQAGDDSGTPGIDAAYLVRGDAAWSNYAVEAAAYAGAETELGLVARYDERGFYRASLRVGEQKSALILTAVGADGSYRELGRLPVGPTLDRWVRLRLEARGEQLTLSLDGGPSLTASDSAFAAGKAGLYAVSDRVARFDNLLVTQQ